MSSSELVSHLQKNFRLPDFRLGQREIIESVLAKKDVLAVLPTGGGKSLCYQFPAVYSRQLVVVISPLIALMRDQVLALNDNGIASGCLYSGQAIEEKARIFAEMKLGGPYLLYLSPERVQKPGFQQWIKNQNLALFAVDEAHCVSQWGHDFREEYSQLHILKSLRPDVPVLALTASATPLVLGDISTQLQLQKPERLVHGFYRPNLYYQVQECGSDEEKEQYLLQALEQTPNGRALIYCGTRKKTEEVAAFLQEKKIAGVGYYHAGLSANSRTQMQESYVRGDLRILVATNAFGMGIDQSDVRLVVHFQLPANIDSLYQEMGRAGRDQQPSTCLLLYAKKDKGLQSYFIQSSEAPAAIRNNRWRNLEALVDYCEGGECRHAEILTYFRDSQRLKRCGHCDVCDPRSHVKIQTPKRPAIVTNPKAPTTKRKHNSAKNSAVVLTADQERIFLILKDWRWQKAQELDVPAFVIFGDKTLRELSVTHPTTTDELQRIYGIGESKKERFGDELLQILRSSSN